MDLIIPVVILAILTLCASLLFRFFFFGKNVKFSSIGQMTDVERLITKKYKEVDVHKQKVYTSIAGLFVIMIFTLVLVEYGREVVEEQIVAKASVNDVFDETLDIPQTNQDPPPPPPAPPIKKSIILQETKEDLIEQLELPVDTMPEEDEFVLDDDDDDDEVEEETVVKVWDFVEEEALPHNGDLFTYSEYIFSKINKGSIVSDMNAGLKGFLEIEMVVLENGDLTGFKTTSSVGPNIDKEITRILHQAPRWTPAKMQGQVVRQKVIFQMMIDY